MSLTENQKITYLSDIFSRHFKISPEHHKYLPYEEFPYSGLGSFDEYLHNSFFTRSTEANSFTMANPFYILSSLIYTLTDIKEIIQDLENENYTKDDKKYKTVISQLLGCLDTLKELGNKYNSETVKNDIDIFTNPWIKLCDKKNIDITVELNNINILKNDLHKLDKISKYSKDLDNFINYFIDLKSGVSAKRDDIIKPVLSKIKEFMSIWYKHEFSNAETFLNHNEIPKLFNSINENIKNIQSKVKSNKICLCVADEYVINESEQNIASFIKKKQEDTTIFTIEIGNNKKFTLFTDMSILYQKNGLSIIPKDTTEAALLSKGVFNDYITHLLRKKPNLSKRFMKEMEMNDYSNYKFMGSCVLSINTLLNHEDILKNNNFDLEIAFEKATKLDGIAAVEGRNYPYGDIFEKLDDEMNKIIDEHKLNKYAHSITSNKYNHLYNKESYIIIKELYELNVEQEILQNLIGKKLAAFKTPEDFNNSLTKLLTSFNGFTQENIIDKFSKITENNENNIIISENNILVLKINNFDESKELGSSSWCISRDDHYFNSYVGYGDNKQYFLYDFNKESRDNNSMIGVTISKDGSIYAAHQKDDTQIYNIGELSRLQLLLLSNEDLKNYPHLNPSLKEIVTIKKLEEKELTKKSNPFKNLANLFKL